MDGSVPVAASGGATAVARVGRDAAVAFRVMFAINLFNYLDRYVLPAVLSSVQKEFHLSDTQSGALGTAFLLVYALSALPFSLWADRGVRKNVVAVCVAIWSIATTLSGFATGFATLFLARALVGVGEAGYFPAGTSLLSDYFPRAARARVMSRWGAGQLLGIAIGFGLGGVIAGKFGWRVAFLVTGLPGLIVAVLAYRMREPVRGASDNWAVPSGAALPLAAQMRTLVAIPTVVVGLALQIFAFWVLGAATYWLPVYLQRAYGFSQGRAGLVSGGALVVAGLAGVLAGGVLADMLTRRFVGGRVLACGIGLVLAAPCFALAVTSGGFVRFLPFFLLTAAFLNVYSGPLTAVTQDVVPPAQRALVVSLTLLIGHVLGDVSSPLIVGAVSDGLGGGAHGLSRALFITCPVLLLCAAAIAFVGARFVGRDLERIEAARVA